MEKISPWTCNRTSMKSHQNEMFNTIQYILRQLVKHIFRVIFWPTLALNFSPIETTKGTQMLFSKKKNENRADQHLSAFLCCDWAEIQHTWEQILFHDRHALRAVLKCTEWCWSSHFSDFAPMVDCMKTGTSFFREQLWRWFNVQFVCNRICNPPSYFCFDPSTASTAFLRYCVKKTSAGV